MKLSKVTGNPKNTYAVIRSNDGSEHLTITLNGSWDVSINKDGTALSLFQKDFARYYSVDANREMGIDLIMEDRDIGNK